MRETDRTSVLGFCLASCSDLKIDLKHFAFHLFSPQRLRVGRGTWGSLIFLNYTCSNDGRVKRFHDLQEKVSK